MSEHLFAERYRLVEALPPGRAAARHRAVDPDGRPVVITVVRPFDADAFLHDAGSVASVRHAGLAALIEAGRDGDACFVVAEEVRGHDAEALVQHGPMDPADAALLGAEAAAALAALHAAGAVHGAVDSSSLVRAADGGVRLTGAGLAAGLPRPDLGPGVPAAAARYLSPEEARGAGPGPAADVYRLGLVLYLLLTGAPAVDGADAAAVTRAHVDGILTPPQMRDPRVPAALGEVVAAALHKDPQQRPSAAALRDRLERLLTGATFVEAPPPPPGSKAPLWIGLAVVVLAVALVAAWAAGLFGGEAEEAVPVAVPDVVGMTTDGATNALEQAGLTVGAVTEAASEEAPVGTVFEQDPAAGDEVEEGGAVDLTVSTGPPAPTAVAVPDVTGMTADEASQSLLGAGFVVVASEVSSDAVAAGAVITQRPSAGVLVAPGSTVEIVVSTGPEASPAPSESASP